MIMTSSWHRGRRSLLLATTGPHAGSLLFPNKVFDKVHVLLNDLLRHSRALETAQECSPRRIDIRRCKSFLRIITHMGNMFE